MNPTNPTTPTTPDPVAPQPPAEAGQRQQTPVKKTQPWLIWLVLVLVVAAVAVGAWMYFANKNNVAQSETPTAAVTAKDNGFSPATIKIQKGQDVTWTNESHAPLQIVGDLKTTGLQQSEAISPGETYSFTFDKTGTFNYHDSSNINHKGTVIVE